MQLTHSSYDVNQMSTTPS